MVDFPLRVRIQVGNWHEFVNELRRRLRGEKVEVGVDIDEEEMREQIRRGLEQLFREPITTRVAGGMQRAAERLQEVFGAGGRRGIRGALEEFLGSRSPLLLSTFVMVEILKNILGNIIDLARRGAEFSGHMQAALRLMDLIFKLALKPIADVVGMLLKPVLLMLLKYVILPWARITSPRYAEWWQRYAEAVQRYWGLLGGAPTLMPLAMFMAGFEMQVRRRLGLEGVGEEHAKQFGEALKKINEQYSRAGQEHAKQFDNILSGVIGGWQKGGEEGAENYGNVLHDVAAKFGIGGLGAAALFREILRTFNISIDESTNQTSDAMNMSAGIFESLVKGAGAPVPTIAAVFAGAARMLIDAYNEMRRRLRRFLRRIEEYRITRYEGGGYTVHTPYELGGRPWSFHVGREWVAGLQMGGLITRTGLYWLHAGELVIPSWRALELGTQVVNNVYEINVELKIDRMSSEFDVRRMAQMLAEEAIREIERRGRM